MLQQTQVATVIPYFERFLDRYPTISDLAKSDEQDLLALWEGLGYYRRARSMHRAAQDVVRLHNGVFPETYDEVLALPGVGRYTAGAILSISRDQRLPILEGNTQRLFSRLVAMRGNVTDKPNVDLLWQISEALLPRSNSGTFNQAAMELGALVCTPKNPRCDTCPLKASCAARAAGLQNEIPGKVKKIKYETRDEFAFVFEKTIKHRQCFLMRTLPPGGRWAGLWDFPRATSKSFGSVDEAKGEIETELGVSIQPGQKLKTLKHAVTKYRISLHVHDATIAKRSPPIKKPWRYVSIEDFADLPMSVTGRKIAEALITQHASN